jgi:hypothetical protein
VATYAAVAAAPAALHKLGGSIKSTAKGSHPSKLAASFETETERTSNDVSGPLSGMLVGTTLLAHFANPSLLAGKRPKKTPNFVSGVDETRAFLAGLASFCPPK